MSKQQVTFAPADSIDTELIPVGQGITLDEKREDTRSHIAKIFTYGYLALLGVLLIFITFLHLSSDTAKDFLLSFSSILGFVIGYYFKSAQE